MVGNMLNLVIIFWFLNLRLCCTSHSLIESLPIFKHHIFYEGFMVLPCKHFSSFRLQHHLHLPFLWYIAHFVSYYFSITVFLLFSYYFLLLSLSISVDKTLSFFGCVLFIIIFWRVSRRHFLGNKKLSISYWTKLNCWGRLRFKEIVCNLSWSRISFMRL